MANWKNLVLAMLVGTNIAFIIAYGKAVKDYAQCNATLASAQKSAAFAKAAPPQAALQSSAAGATAANPPATVSSPSTHKYKELTAEDLNSEEKEIMTRYGSCMSPLQARSMRIAWQASAFSKARNEALDILKDTGYWENCDKQNLKNAALQEELKQLRQ